MSDLDLDLSTLPWTVTGWRPYSWRWKAQEINSPLQADVAAVPMRVPGSVQQALRDAGKLPDWNIGLNSRDIEWVEHRHWELACEIPAGRIPPGQRVILDALGLDYSGWIIVDGKEVADFCGALIPHRVELSSALGDGRSHRLAILFDEPPAEYGQMGYTSHSRFFKPRFSFGWDWVPRIVPIGVWDAIGLRWGVGSGLELTNVQTTVSDDLQRGSISVRARLDPKIAPPAGATLIATWNDGPRVVRTASTALAPGDMRLALAESPIELWWPNGKGSPRTYTLNLSAMSGDTVLWSAQRTVGFRTIEWRPCDGAPAGAEPWICVVNRKPVFLQGANWTPAAANYHDTAPEQYHALIKLYQELGANVLRVWGGGYLEREIFYDQCDSAGLLVWQEFPLSSSGIDNWPPEDPADVMQLTKIARSYIQRRQSHPSLLLWCGGNELQGGLDGSKSGVGQPVDRTHPATAAMADVVHAEDPGRRFLPTSASGPRFMASAADFGKGLHHDVHGPWSLDDGGIAGWKKYWDADDALFRSEVGAPGASSVETIEGYSGGLPTFPPTGEYWNHSASWWIQWSRWSQKCSRNTLADYVEGFAAEQAELLAYAASRCKARFPRCGGFIVWMGHDCFPIPANTAIIEFNQKPKPAYFALKKVFKSATA